MSHYGHSQHTTSVVDRIHRRTYRARPTSQLCKQGMSHRPVTCCFFLRLADADWKLFVQRKQYDERKQEKVDYRGTDDYQESMINSFSVYLAIDTSAVFYLNPQSSGVRGRF